MKRTFSRLFSLTLVLCMLCSMFSFTALADETEAAEKTTVDVTVDSPYIMVNIADQFDTSVIGKVGETYGDNWVTGSSYKVGHNGSDGWGLDCNVGADGIFTGSFTKTVEDDTTITNYNYAPTYKLDRATWTSAANDAIYLGNDTSIKLSGRPLDRVSVIIYTGYETGASYLNLAVKSENSDDITREMINIGWHQDTSGDNNYPIWSATNNDYRWRQLIAPSDSTFAKENDTLVTLETRGDYTSGTSQAKLTEWGIDLDGTEIPETLELSLTTGSLTARTAVYALAVTEIGVSTDVLKAGIAAAEGIEADTMTAEQAKTVNLANRYADEMILRGLAVENDYTALRALAEPAEWYSNQQIDEPFIPVNMTYTSDIIGCVGEEYDTSTWAMASSSPYIGIDGSADHALYNNISSENILSIDADGDSTTEGTYDYYINREGLSAKKLDSIPLTTTAFTLNTSGRPISQLAFLQTVLSSGTYRTLTFSLKYKDGSTNDVTSSQFTQNTSTDLANNFLSFSLRCTATGDWCRVKHGPVAGSDGKLILDETNNSSTATGIYKVHYVAVDPTKELESVSVKANVANKEMYLLAATEIPAATADLQAKIDTVNEIALADVSEENAADIMLANRYADELYARYITHESEFAHLRELKAAAAWYAEAAENIPFIPMDIEFNADIIGKTGEIAGDNWAYGVTDANKRFGLSGDAGRVLAENISDNTIAIHKGGHTSDSGNYIEGDTYYKYRINSSSLSVGDSDALSVSTTKATIKASGRPVEKIALVKYAFLNPGGVPVNYTVNYTDGTSVTTTSKEYWASSELTYVNWYGTGTADGIDWNRDSQYLLPNATTNALEAYTSSTSNYDSTVHAASGGMKAFQILYLPVDKTKTVDNIEIYANYGSGMVFFLAATEIPAATADLQAKIAEVEALSVDSVTGDNAADIMLANRYADELYARYITHESEFAHLRELKVAAEWYDAYEEPAAYKVDISDDFNADLLGKEGDTITDVEAFNTVITNNAFYHDYRGATEAFEYDEATDSGVYTVYERTPDGEYWDSAYETASDKTVPIYLEGLQTNVNDAVNIGPNNPVMTFDLTGRPSKELRFAAASTTASSWNVTVTYLDGSKTDAAGDLLNADGMIDNSDGTTSYPEEIYISHTSNIAWGSTAVSGVREDNICGWFAFTANPEDKTDRGYYLVLDENDKLVKTKVSAGRSAEAGPIGLYKLPLDPTKVPVSVTFTFAEGSDVNPINLWGITEIPTATADIEGYLTAYQETTISYINTADESAEAKKMMWYANELEERHYKKASSYQTVVKRYNQALAQDEIYVDIASQHTLDADLFVKIDDEAVGTPTRENLLYRGDSIADSGLITMNGPSDEDFASILTGASFKLSGSFQGAGYDSVRMESGAEDKSFTLSNKQLKAVGFILSADIASESSDMLNAYVTYDDGKTQKEEITVYGPNTTVGIKTNAYLQISTAAKYDAETNTYVSGAANDIAAMKVVPAFIKADPTKKVASVTFEAADDFSYSIVAVTELPYTNDEVYNGYIDLISGYVDDVTEETAEETLKLCALGYEAEERTLISEEWAEDIDEYYIAAYDILNSVLSFETSVTTDSTDAIATVTMTNTTKASQTYQLIIAAYDGERLVGVNFTEEKTLESGKENVTDSVKLGLISGATYKAFVWSGFGDMIPLAD